MVCWALVHVAKTATKRLGLCAVGEGDMMVWLATEHEARMVTVRLWLPAVSEGNGMVWWATGHEARMETVSLGLCAVSEGGRDGMLGDGARGEDGDCASRALCGQ